jgi:DNA polymerase I-like protein with 3'-5' exonuclease and polymerase domains
MLAHFMNNALYTSTVLHGDIHTFNQEMAGLATRDMAKKFIYMFLYGAGIPNLARQIGMNESQMGQCVAKFKESLPDLDNLLDRVQSAGQNFGYLLSVDGRWGRLRVKNGKLALNTALNVLLQMTGSLVMKWAHVRAEDELVRIGYMESVSDMPIVAHVHDEGQFEIDADQVTTMQYEILKDDWKEEEKKQYIDDRGIWSAPTKVDRPANDEGCIVVQRCFHIVGDQYCKALTWAGEELGLRCPTAGEYSIGDSWNETH